jgi:hypothetical protein
MALNDLQRGNELAAKIQDISDNIALLEHALNSTGRETKRFFFSCREKNKIHIDGGCISFGGHLKVDRECMELIRNYFQNKLTEANAELERIGKDNE